MASDPIPTLTDERVAGILDRMRDQLEQDVVMLARVDRKRLLAAQAAALRGEP